MDEYCIKILLIVRDYQKQYDNGIGISVLDRKFYKVYEYGEVSLTEKIKWLQREEYIEKERPYSVSLKGTQFLNEFEKDDFI